MNRCRRCEGASGFFLILYQKGFLAWIIECRIIGYKRLKMDIEKWIDATQIKIKILAFYILSLFLNKIQFVLLYLLY